MRCFCWSVSSKCFFFRGIVLPEKPAMDKKRWNTCDLWKRKANSIVSEFSRFVRAIRGQKVKRKGFVFVPFSLDLSQTINPGVRDWISVKCFVCLFYSLKKTTPFYNTGFWIFLSWWVGTPWALSIQPKIPEILVGTSNGTDHFGLVRPEYSGQLSRWSTLTGLVISVGRTEMSLSIWQNCCTQYRSFVSCLQEQ